MYVSPPHRREPQKTPATPPASAGRQMAHTFATARAGRPGGAIIRPGAASRGRAGRRLAAGAVVRGT